MKKCFVSALLAHVSMAVDPTVDATLPFKCTGDVATVPLDFVGCVNVDENLLDDQHVFLNINGNLVGSTQYDIQTDATYFFEEGFSPELPYICFSENVVCDDDSYESLRAMNCTNNISVDSISAFTVEATTSYVVRDDKDRVVFTTFGNYCMESSLRIGNFDGLNLQLQPTPARVCTNNDLECTVPSTPPSPNSNSTMFDEMACYNIHVVPEHISFEEACSPAFFYYAKFEEESATGILYRYDSDSNTCEFDRLVTSTEFCEDGLYIYGLLMKPPAKNLCACDDPTDCQIIGKMVNNVCPIGFRRSYKVTNANTFAVFDEHCRQITFMKVGACKMNMRLSDDVPPIDFNTERKVVDGVFFPAVSRLIEAEDVASVSNCNEVFYYLGFDRETHAITYLDDNCNQQTGSMSPTRNQYGLIEVTAGSVTYYFKNMYSESASNAKNSITQSIAAINHAELERCRRNCSPNTASVSHGTVSVQAAPLAAGRSMSVRPNSASLSAAEAAAVPSAINFTPGPTFTALIGTTIPGTTCTVESVYMGTYIYTIQNIKFSEVSFYAVPAAGCTDPKAVDTPLKITSLPADEKVAIQYPIDDSNFSEIASGTKSLVCKYYDEDTDDLSTEGVTTVVDSVSKSVDCIASHTTPFAVVLENSFVKGSDPFVCEYSDDSCTTEVQCYPLFAKVDTPTTNVYYYDVTTADITVSVTNATPSTTSFVFTASGQCVSRHSVSNVSLLTSNTNTVDGSGTNNAVVPSALVAATAACLAATLF
eukprot:GDKJ01003560.1.p1 GENE.GDKJ01003560.1~~GDKJ01003560.1.p1  ORF type:complete len:764 (-),score=165.12 GDKJ01003560.1:397-2688(-)